MYNNKSRWSVPEDLALWIRPKCPNHGPPEMMTYALDASDHSDELFTERKEQIDGIHEIVLESPQERRIPAPLLPSQSGGRRHIRALNLGLREHAASEESEVFLLRGGEQVLQLLQVAHSSRCFGENPTSGFQVVVRSLLALLDFRPVQNYRLVAVDDIDFVAHFVAGQYLAEVASELSFHQ